MEASFPQERNQERGEVNSWDVQQVVEHGYAAEGGRHSGEPTAPVCRRRQQCDHGAK
jgi:hypothetical protein